MIFQGSGEKWKRNIMKNRKNPVADFDDALKEAGRDLAREMGYKGESRKDLPNGPANNPGILSGVIGFIKTKMQQIKR